MCGARIGDGAGPTSGAAVGPAPGCVGILIAGTPMGRLGRADEMTALIAFVASDDASFVTGSEFVADGGVTAG